MKKSPSLLALALLAAGVVHAQSLDDIQRVQRRGQLVMVCEDLAKRGVSDEACKDIAQPRQEAASESGSAGRQKAHSVGVMIDITAYRAGLIGGIYQKEIEASVDGQMARMHVGDTVSGWKLTRLTDYEAEFRSVRNKKAAPKIIGFRAPVAPAPAPANTSNSTNTGGLYVPPPVMNGMPPGGPGSVMPPTAGPGNPVSPVAPPMQSN